MLKIYDIETARKTILFRSPLSAMTFTAKVLERTTQLFGAGVTPQKAVARILASVQVDGNAALRYWSELLDRTAPAEFRAPLEEMGKGFPIAACRPAGCNANRSRAHPPLPRIPAAP